MNKYYNTVMPCGYPLKSIIIGFCAMHLFSIFWGCADSGFGVEFKL